MHFDIFRISGVILGSCWVFVFRIYFSSFFRCFFCLFLKGWPSYYIAFYTSKCTFSFFGSTLNSSKKTSEKTFKNVPKVAQKSTSNDGEPQNSQKTVSRPLPGTPFSLPRPILIDLGVPLGSQNWRKMVPKKHRKRMHEKLKWVSAGGVQEPNFRDPPPAPQRWLKSPNQTDDLQRPGPGARRIIL